MGKLLEQQKAAVCECKNTRWLHNTQKECNEAECLPSSFDVCNLVICVDCGESVTE